MGWTKDQQQHWADNGWLHVPAVLSGDTVDSLDGWVSEVESWATGAGPGLHHFEATAAGPRITRSEDFVPYHDRLRSLILEGSVPSMVGEILGEPAGLFKEKINYKYPGGAGYAPHQDATAYPLGSRHVSVMLSLDAATVESGCLWFAPAPWGRILANTSGRIDDEVARELEWSPLPAAPGDVVLFDAFTPHFSRTNESVHRRRALYLTYTPASDGDLRTAYYERKRDLLAAAEPGGDTVRVSVNDDFLGVPVANPSL